MRNRQEVNINNVYKGMRIKSVLPSRWAEVMTSSPYVWMKGKVTGVNKRDGKVTSINVRIKWSKCQYYFKINLQALPSENGVFTSIYKAL